MNDNIRRLLEELEEFDKKNYVFNVPREGGEFLNLLVKLKKPKSLLEVGTSNGYSTIWLAMESNNVTTIEKDSYRAGLAQENFRKAGLKNIKLVTEDALEVLPKLKERFDFVFLDAVKKDYINYFKLIKFEKGAIIVADNILTHDLDEYCDFVRNKYKSLLVKIGNGMEVTVV